MIERAMRQTLSEQVLQEAATWMMEMREGPLSPQERERFNQWRLRSKENELAWQKAAVLLDKLQSVPAPGAMALKTVTRSSRRTTLKTLVALLAIGPTAWVAYRYSPWSAGGDIIATGRGERRDLVLEDGTKLTLNSSTEIQIQYADDARHVRLLSGEILISTGQDVRTPARPFLVDTAQGHLRPLGTRFTARQLEGRSHLAVYEGAVEITPSGMPEARQVIAAGYQAIFSEQGIEPPTKNDALSLSWMNGMLVTDQMPLAAVATELERYRPGLVQVDTKVAALPVSGVFPLGDTTASLTLLEQTLPVRIHYFTRYWVRVVPK